MDVQFIESQKTNTFMEQAGAELGQAQLKLVLYLDSILYIFGFSIFYLV